MNSKQIISIILSFLLLISGSRGIIYWLEFKLNHIYIVKELCIEKDKPKNTCQGKCHLKKNLDRDGNENDYPIEKMPKLRINFDENNVGVFVNKLIIKYQDDSYNELKFIEHSIYQSYIEEPPCPPPRV